jgi:hypothetical protein
MDYTPEQRAIIARLGDISARFDAAAEANQVAQAAAARNIVEMGNALLAAVERSGELVNLNRQYGDAFREFLDTL